MIGTKRALHAPPRQSQVSMEIVYHIGSQCTDEDRLIRSLLRNRGPLAREGIEVPAPGRYRPVLRDALIALRGAPASTETQEAIIDAMLDDRSARRVVLSHEYFLGIPSRVVSPRGFHAATGRRIAAIANLFPDWPCEFHMALRNPATLLPALIGRINGATYASVMGDRDPMSLRWAPVFEDILATLPDAKLVVWCNEDSPLIWGQVMRRVAGAPDGLRLEGADDLLAAVVSPEGLARMNGYLAANPGSTPAQRERVAAAFLDKFGLPEEMEVDLAFPGWTEGLVAEMTEAYEADVAAIAGMPGVEIIPPRAAPRAAP